MSHNHDIFDQHLKRKTLYSQPKVFAVCHMMGILSAIANPLLYGYFNKVATMLWIF